MDKIKLANGMLYSILDYATPNSFTVLLNGITASEVLENLTEVNLSEIHFLTNSGAVTGVYHNKILMGYTDNGSTLDVIINDVGSGDIPEPIPEPVEPTPTLADRVFAVEEQLAFTKIILGVE